jgi:hypothetical protein
VHQLWFFRGNAWYIWMFCLADASKISLMDVFANFMCVYEQVGAIISGVQPGLTMVVGPPGTGKTDTAVQVLNVLYHNCPTQRTLLITHSNQALNDLFEKIMQVGTPLYYVFVATRLSS